MAREFKYDYIVEYLVIDRALGLSGETKISVARWLVHQFALGYW